MKIFGVDHRPWPTNLKWLALACGAMLLISLMIHQYLVTPSAAPQGLISYELAGDSEAAAQVRARMAEGGFNWPQFSLYFDFPFIALYALFLLKLTRHLLKDRPGVREQQVGKVAKGMFVLGAGGDAAENVLLLSAIAHPDSTTLPMAAVFATLVKLTGLLMGAGFLLFVRAARRHPLHADEH